jgi:membrane protein YdbS with pleckstrin-like domain
VNPAEAPAVASVISEPEFRNLDPRVIKLWRVRHAIVSVVLLGMATIAVISVGLATTPLVVARRRLARLLLLRVVLLFWYPRAVVPIRGAIASMARCSRQKHGIWFRIHQLLPLSRLQHVDLHSGPIERSFGLASLLLHTAGTQHASIVVPGLDAREAGRMRDELVAMIGGDDGV